jgi:hypothetical protein
MDGPRNVAKKEDELYGGLHYPFLSFDTSPLPLPILPSLETGF